MSITMYTTSACGACKLVKASGVVEDLGIEVINIDEEPSKKPENMAGAPFFVKRVEGTIRTHTGYANEEMLRTL